MSAVRPLLLRLLRRAEAAARRGDQRPAALPMTAASCPEYAALDSLDALERFHAGIALAERDGAISVARDRHHDDGARLLRIVVADSNRLATHLGVTLGATAATQARQRLAPWIEHFPVLEQLVSLWAGGRRWRQQGPEAVTDLLDALRLASDVAAASDHERILRRESVRLFGDSKRIEALTPWLELLLSGELAVSGLDREAIWAAYGLRRQPQPLLLSGRARIVSGERRLELLRPYLGLPPEAVHGLAEPVGFLLSVENLSSFHDLAAGAGESSGLIGYSAGMPSPSWRRAWARLLASLPTCTPVYHWGDLDQGGLRIAETMADIARASGHRLLPWLMHPDEFSASELATAATPDPSTLARMLASARRCGWHALADALARRPLLLEQEACAARLPLGAGGEPIPEPNDA